MLFSRFQTQLAREPDTSLKLETPNCNDPSLYILLKIDRAIREFTLLLAVNCFYNLIHVRFACKKTPAMPVTPPRFYSYTSPSPSSPPLRFLHHRHP
jgi:hypothetical protein